MTNTIKKHPIYKLDTEGVDFSNFRVLLVYANSPMDNLFPIGLSSIAGMLKKHKIDYIINLAAQAGVRYSITNPE